MYRFAQQLAAAAAHAARQRNAANAAAKAREEETRQRRLAAQRTWAARGDAGKFAATGMIAAVLDALPASADRGLTLREVEARLADIPHAASGVSSTLTSLIKQGKADRTGELRHYRYFRL